MLKKLNKIYPLQLEIVPLFLLLLIVYLTLISYPGLPDIVPTHFNSQGLPDDWGSKNEIFVYLGMAVFIYALLTGIVLALAVNSDPLKLINLPPRLKERIKPVEAEILRVYVIRCLLAMKILILGLNMFLSYNTVEVAFNRSSGIGYWPFTFVLGILITVGFMMYKIFSATSERAGSRNYPG